MTHNHLEMDNTHEGRIRHTMAEYGTDVDGAAVEAAVEKILQEDAPGNNTAEVKRTLLSCLDLTSLRSTDNDQSIIDLVDKVNDFTSAYPTLPYVAGVCVYPCFADVLKSSLSAPGVQRVCVAGSFPTSQARVEVKVAEVSLAVADGANEIDIVLPVGKFLADDLEEAASEIEQQKEACRGAHLKVILETGLLPTYGDIRRASILAMYSGADFIKTSTGKEKVSATPQAAYVMCQAIKEYHQKTGTKIGFKPAGGINTVEDAIAYYSIVERVLGKEWLNNKLFRIGTTRLANLLVGEIEGQPCNYF